MICPKTTPRHASTSNGSAHCCFGEGGGEDEWRWPPHPAGRGGQGSSRCPALRDRSMAGLPCSASGEARLPHRHHGQLRYDAGRPQILGSPPLSDPSPCPRSVADRCLDHARRRMRVWPTCPPEYRARERMVRSLRLRWTRLGWRLCPTLVRNRDRSASRLAPWSRNRSLMCAHGPDRLRSRRRRRSAQSRGSCTPMERFPGRGMLGGTRRARTRHEHGRAGRADCPPWPRAAAAGGHGHASRRCADH